MTFCLQRDLLLKKTSWATLMTLTTISSSIESLEQSREVLLSVQSLA